MIPPLSRGGGGAEVYYKADRFYTVKPNSLSQIEECPYSCSSFVINSHTQNEIHRFTVLTGKHLTL